MNVEFTFIKGIAIGFWYDSAFQGWTGNVLLPNEVNIYLGPLYWRITW